MFQTIAHRKQVAPTFPNCHLCVSHGASMKKNLTPRRKGRKVKCLTLRPLRLGVRPSSFGLRARPALGDSRSSGLLLISQIKKPHADANFAGFQLENEVVSGRCG